MLPGRWAQFKNQLTVYATFCLTGLVALALVTGIGIGGHLGVVAAFGVMGLLGVGVLLLYGQYVARAGEPADPPVGPNGDGS